MSEKKLIGLLPVRNEAWILGLSARVALLWCDELVIFDHASTDASLDIELDIAGEHPNRVTLMGDANPTWDEMRHRQAMLEMARTRGATHIAIIDADEVLTGNLVPKMNRLVKDLPLGAILQVPLYNMRGGWRRYHANGIWADRIVSIALRDNPAAGWSGDRFHRREPLDGYNPLYPVQQGEGGVMHMWGTDERRLIAKHALYKVTERLRWPRKSVADIDQLYSLAIHPAPVDGEWRFRSTPDLWWQDINHLALQHVREEDVPWQEAEVRRLFASKPAGYFDGLDLFGVA
jgi:hypothetical protein